MLSKTFDNPSKIWYYNSVKTLSIMKLLAKVIMVIAMMCTGVQVHAQYHRPAPRYHHPHHSYYYHRPVYHYNPYYYGYRYIPYSAYVWYPMHRYWYYSPLDLYIWGSSYNRPDKIKIECLEFKRVAHGKLRIKNGKDKTLLSVYKDHHLRYTCPSGTKVDVVIGNGEAKITAYDSKGEIAAEHTL